MYKLNQKPRHKSAEQECQNISDKKQSGVVPGLHKFFCKKAKCPVTFVVNVLKERTPLILTMPATKESMEASRKL